MPKMTDESVRRMVAMYVGGVGTPQIAKELGCSKKTVQTKLKAAGVFVGRKKFTNKDIAEMTRLFLSGVAVKNIGISFGVGERVVRKILTSHGVYKVGEIAWDNHMRSRAKEMYCNGKSIGFISSELGVGFSTISSFLRKSGVWKYKGVKKYSCDRSFFENINTETQAYWLGFIMADGNIQLSRQRACLHIGIHRGDIEHLRKFKDAVRASNPIRIKDCDSTCNIDIYDRNLVESIRSLGIATSKTFCLDWKEITSCFAKDLRRHFIRGYFDGDGSWRGIKQVSFNIACASKNFIYPLQRELVTGVNLNYVKIQHRNNCYSLDYGGRHQLLRLSKYLYQNSSVFLERKRDKIESYLKQF